MLPEIVGIYLRIKVPIKLFNSIIYKIYLFKYIRTIVNLNLNNDMKYIIINK